MDERQASQNHKFLDHLNKTSTGRPRSPSIAGYPTTGQLGSAIFNSGNDSLRGNAGDGCGEAEWTLIQNAKKRPLRSPETHDRQLKQSKLKTYWLSNPVTTSNRFSSFGVGEKQDTPTVSKEREKVIKPPPIFVDKVSNIQPLIKLLNEQVNDNYEIKVLRNEAIKIQPKASEAYSKIVKELEARQTEFYTFKPKKDRSFKAILKNMHPSTETSEIVEALSKLGHEATNVWNIKQRVTKNPLPLFIVELKQKENNKLIYDTKSLLHCKVSFVPPRPRRELPQCANCQQYGHTKSYCRRSPKCIKCAGDHNSADCTRKGRSDNVKCVLCEGNHPANYKGCKVYKELQALKFPPVGRRAPVLANTRNNMAATSMVNNAISYAQATQSKMGTPRYGSSIPQVAIETESTSDLKDMLKQIFQQISEMTNLLLNLMSKMSNSIH